MKKVQLLDCTLRDGAYIVDGNFGKKNIKGIIKKLVDSRIDIIECGWLKNPEYSDGTTYYHMPQDMVEYVNEKKPDTLYVAMIDYNRYDIGLLPQCDGQSLDAIRVVFPKDKVDEGIALVDHIRECGYKVFLQAANTLAYSDRELIDLCEKINSHDVQALSIVDTFGSMDISDLRRIFLIIDNNLRKDISLGFHSHNNRQLSFSLSMEFVELITNSKSRNGIVDSSLCGMGRGAGNTPTELISDYLNEKQSSNYDLDSIMDVIDVYMTHFMKKYKWGYSIPYMLAGKYQCHVNNVAYLTGTHRSKSKDINNILAAMSKEERRQYDYALLDVLYNEYQSQKKDDRKEIGQLQKKLKDKCIVVIAPGIQAKESREKVQQYIDANECLVAGVNAVVPGYKYDYLFFSNALKYELALEQGAFLDVNGQFILTSNIKNSDPKDREIIINYSNLLKRYWKYYENSMIMFLRLLNTIGVREIAIVGFDGYDLKHDNYVDELLDPQISYDELELMQNEIREMFCDFINTKSQHVEVNFLTESKYIVSALQPETDF